MEKCLSYDSPEKNGYYALEKKLPLIMPKGHARQETIKKRSFTTRMTSCQNKF
jgi:hypothetical protein